MHENGVYLLLPIHLQKPYHRPTQCTGQIHPEKGITSLCRLC